jgi:hypothetical protein
MSTLIAVVILIVIGFFGQTFWLTVLNLAGLPGALIGGVSPSRCRMAPNLSRDNLGRSRAILRLSRLRRARCSWD